MRIPVERDLNPPDEPELTWEQEHDLVCNHADDLNDRQAEEDFLNDI